MERTVRDFKNFVLQQSRLRTGSEFQNGSIRRAQFWAKLNRIGARNMEQLPPSEDVPDVDATVELTHEEWGLLEQEFRHVLRDDK